MNLHEYQSKALYRTYNIPVPNGQIAKNLDEVEQACNTLKGDKWVVKAQVHAGGRGKAGGVKLVSSIEEAKTFAATLLGKNLVTHQTDDKGQPINCVLVEQTCNIARELYLGAVIDRSQQRMVVMASTEGGMDIEKVAEETPEKILKVAINPLTGVMPYQSRELAFGLGLEGTQIRQFVSLLDSLVKLFVDNDLSLIEVNPLVVTQEGNLECLDGKINIDDNAMYRHKDLMEWRDKTQEDEREIRASEWELNYISLDGEIGCMVNGAGLAMATMDMIQLHGGKPANFLDVGGTVTAERVTEAFKIIMSDEQVKAIFVNIFGGIVRCDIIAQGIVDAAKQVDISIPLIVRLEGNQAEKGIETLKNSDVEIITPNNFSDAAKKAVASVEVK
jgi:succinyl-CoA synthetase beta subunit